MRTTILTVMLAASVMGAENPWEKQGVSYEFWRLEQLNNRADERIRELVREEFHKLRAEESQQMMLSFKTNNFTLCGGYPGQPDVGLTNISAAWLTNLSTMWTNNTITLPASLPHWITEGVEFACATNTIRVLDTNALIKAWCAEGKVCAIKGHLWEGLPHVTLEYRPDGNYPMHRQCRLCGKQQTYSAEWKD